MKVKFVLTAVVVREVAVGRHAENIDDEVEQELSELQDDSESQHELLNGADLVTVVAEKLIVR